MNEYTLEQKRYAVIESIKDLEKELARNKDWHQNLRDEQLRRINALKEVVTTLDMLMQFKSLLEVLK